MDRVYIAIDLKSFYASVECVERGLDPMNTNLVVADETRTEKTICLAVSPSLKAYGIPGRPRLFEVVQKVREENALRQLRAPNRVFSGRSYLASALKKSPALEIDYITAPPRMAYYIEYSTLIYRIYLKYVAPEDIHVYSIDEVFIDATNYLCANDLTAREFAMKMILDVLHTTGITAAAGIGTNLYLCKVAMDIVAKHIPPDRNGVRIAELDEMSYRRMLWSHRPLTDFWRIGGGCSKKLEENGIFTMGDIALRSVYEEDMLYKLFGINAELLIDHAWGWEPCTIADIKAYKPRVNIKSYGQVLATPYNFDSARIIISEMADRMSLDLTEKNLVTNKIVLTVGYDAQTLLDPKISADLGEVTLDRYGRKIPKHAHGTANLERYTSSFRLIAKAVTELFDSTVNKQFLVRRLNISADNVISENDVPEEIPCAQLDLFTDFGDNLQKEEKELRSLEREKNMQRAIIGIKKKFGKNAVIKAMDLQEGATAISRNGQIGGHKS